jgi:hypothetical protein
MSKPDVARLVKCWNLIGHVKSNKNIKIFQKKHWHNSSKGYIIGEKNNPLPILWVGHARFCTPTTYQVLVARLACLMNKKTF